MAGVETERAHVLAARHGRDRTTVKAMIYAYYQAVNDSRWDDVVAFFHEDAVLLIPSQLPKVGHAEIRRFYVSVDRQFPTLHHDDVPLLMIEGNRVMTLVDMHGVNADGVATRLWTAGIFTLEAGRIRQYRVIFDTAQLDGPSPPGVE
jgi:ketosteroid isomerase-like protein